MTGPRYRTPFVGWLHVLVVFGLTVSARATVKVEEPSAHTIKRYILFIDRDSAIFHVAEMTRTNLKWAQAALDWVNQNW